MTDNPAIDPVAIAIALATILFAPEIAHVVGPYLVILFASTIGASFALAARESSTRFNAFLFFIRVNGLSVLLTYTIAVAVNAAYPLDDIRSWFSAIAFVLGFIGDRWPAVLMWGGRKMSRLIDILIRMRGDGGGRG